MYVSPLDVSSRMANRIPCEWFLHLSCKALTSDPRSIKVDTNTGGIAQKHIMVRMLTGKAPCVLDPKYELYTCIHVKECSYRNSVAGILGEDFNLAVWQMVKYLPNIYCNFTNDYYKA